MSMRFVSRFIPFVVLAGVLAGCSTSPAAPANSPSGATSAPSPKPSPTAPAAGPLGALPIPSGARAFSSNTSRPMGLDAFVRAFYIKSAWTAEEGQFHSRGFRSGALEGWINSDGSQQTIAIMHFATVNGAVSELDDLTGAWRQESPKSMLTDAAVRGTGWVDRKLDSLGNARVEIATRLGDTIIDVHEFTASAPDIPPAKALILSQFDSLTHKA
jgi:hypothetical protein